ncbi:MAG: hypothetical protein CL775_04575 [Chloroflexi bacterium]|nr:hypothetical protein [Chloroflexota bacterium]|tara:strand:- start:424 stop:1200 length:777 start_codon:yes stop_codon:yes gene_type:complete
MTDLKFIIGDPSTPSGHAMVYFDSDGILYAAYIIDLPITAEDISKYIPPIYKEQIDQLEIDKMMNKKNLAYPLGPEKYEGDLISLKKLCKIRKDDLLYGGTIEIINPINSMSKLNQIADEYSELCKKFFDENLIIGEIFKKSSNDLNNKNIKDENTYSIMNEANLLTELTKIIGEIDYAETNNEKETIRIQVEKIKSIKDLLPANRKIDEIIFHVNESNEKSKEIISILLLRAFSLLNEDYIKVQELENMLIRLESEN